MKHLLLSLLVAFTLASCGKDGNQVNRNYSYTDPLTNPNIGNDWASKSILISANTDLQNHTTQFGVGYFYAASSSSENCKVKWKLVYVCSTSTTSSGTKHQFKDIMNQASTKLYWLYTDGSYAQNSAIDVTDRVNYLSSLFARATRVGLYASTLGGKRYEVIISANEYYVIDTSLPVQANPVTSVMNGSYKQIYNFEILP